MTLEQFEANQLNSEIEQLRSELVAMPDSPRKDELIAQLDSLHPEALESSDEVLTEVRENFTDNTNNLIRKVMKNKAYLLLICGVVIAIIGFKMVKSNQ